MLRARKPASWRQPPSASISSACDDPGRSRQPNSTISTFPSTAGTELPIGGHATFATATAPARGDGNLWSFREFVKSPNGRRSALIMQTLVHGHSIESLFGLIRDSDRPRKIMRTNLAAMRSLAPHASVCKQMRATAPATHLARVVGLGLAAQCRAAAGVPANPTNNSKASVTL